MTVNPYLSFDGNCREAFEFYKELLGGELFVMTYGDSPMASELPPENHDRVIHAHLMAGDIVLMGGEAPSGEYRQPQGISINIQTGSVDEGSRIFEAFAQDGKVTMPFEETFWVERFGMVRDRFGTPWMVNAGKDKP
jgi:PhnB protein